MAARTSPSSGVGLADGCADDQSSGDRELVHRRASTPAYRLDDRGRGAADCVADRVRAPRPRTPGRTASDLSAARTGAVTRSDLGRRYRTARPTHPASVGWGAWMPWQAGAGLRGRRARGEARPKSTAGVPGATSSSRHPRLLERLTEVARPVGACRRTSRRRGPTAVGDAPGRTHAGGAYYRAHRASPRGRGACTATRARDASRSCRMDGYRRPVMGLEVGPGRGLPARSPGSTSARHSA